VRALTVRLAIVPTLIRMAVLLVID